MISLSSARLSRQPLSAQALRLLLSAFVGLPLALLPGCVTTASLDSPILRAKNRVAPALVHIRPVKEVFSEGRREEMIAIGSGFIISADGYIVTNEHVAGESSVVHVILGDRREVEAKVVGTDPYTDLAVLKLDIPQELPFVTLGESADLEAGERVLAMGSPHGLSRSVSEGIISVTDRYLENHGNMVSPFNNWLQTDAAINPGNSGGPLVNLKGEVIGVNSRVLTGAENVGFAIPIDVAKDVVNEIIEKGHVERSTFGFTLQEMLAKTDDPNLQGVLIADVDPLSVGAEAGVLPGDVLESINGVPVNARFEEDLPAVQKRMADLSVGEEVSLTVARAGEDVEITLKPEELSQLRGQEKEFGEWAFTASNLTSDQVRRAGLQTRLGVNVSGTQVGGPAGQSGLQQGDVILKMDGEDIKDLEHFSELYKKRLESGQPLVLLFVKRGALTRFVLVEKNAAPLPMAAPAPETVLEPPAQQEGER